MAVHIVIPARFASSRLPGKPLADIAGRPMVVRVAERAATTIADDVTVAVDDKRVQRAVSAAGFNAVLTDVEHTSGSDRTMEVARINRWHDDDILVNVQGDEPLIPIAVINRLVESMTSSHDLQMATVAEPLDSFSDFINPNVVKVVIDRNGCALYFSRSPIPWAREESSGADAKLPRQMQALKHLGIYAYRVSMLNAYVNWPQTELEQAEKLEQLRVLWYGVKIHTGISRVPIPPGIDTEKDLQRVIALIDSTR